MTLTRDQLDIMFLMAAGMWLDRPLSPMAGIYLGQSVYVDGARWDYLHQQVIAIELATKALSCAK